MKGQRAGVQATRLTHSNHRARCSCVEADNVLSESRFVIIVETGIDDIMNEQ